MEKQQIGFDARTGLCEHAPRQAHDAMQVAFVQQLAFGLHKSVFVSAEKQPLVHYHTRPAVGLQAVYDFLQKQHLGG